MDAKARTEERERRNEIHEDSEQNGAWLSEEPKSGCGLKRATRGKWACSRLVDPGPEKAGVCELFS